MLIISTFRILGLLGLTRMVLTVEEMGVCVGAGNGVAADRQRRVWIEVEIHPFALDGVGTALLLGVNRADVLAEDAEEHELQRGHEREPDDHRRLTHSETVPEQDLVEQIERADEKREYGARNPAKVAKRSGTFEWFTIPRAAMS